MPSSFAFDDFSPAGGGRVTAVLGPTNTGKTHYALERMLAHRSGMIGLPLRLLAREIYDRVVKLKGPRAVALVTGEEKIIPPSPQYWVATVEAMPLEREVEFLAIDEVQLAADRERGRIFTSRILHARGTSETLLLGSDTMRPVLQRLFRDIRFLSRERFSRLSYAGSKKVTRLPRRTAIVAFSSDMVYATAELIRRQRGGAAVILGALSPRTRNAQAELYHSGDVDYLVATDAIGMGLNMDIDHVAFAAKRKFDGRSGRNLTAAEMAQIAGRAGRHIRDGTFGVTANCAPLDEDITQAIEDHQFDPVTALQWRSERIDLSSVPALLHSLNQSAPRMEFIRSRREDDEDALHRLLAHDDIRDIAKGGAALSTLWDICQIPDFRKITHDQHSRLLGEIYLLLMRDGRVPDAWLAPRIEPLDRIDGDIDALSARISHIRTWTYLSHRGMWLENAPYWQERARAIEDRLSDALHEKLTQRFVDRRTSALLKRLKDDTPLLAGVTDDGEVIVEGQFIGRLLGFEFIVDPRAIGAEAKSLRAAGEKALRPIMAARAAALANAAPGDLTLGDDGAIFWRSAKVAQLTKGPAALRPDVVISGLSDITPNMRGRVEDRLKDFVTARIEGLLGPLVVLQTAANADGDNALNGLTKGVAYRVVENFGATSRTQFADELKQIAQEERAKLRKIGIRFGEYTLHMPALLKPAPASLLTLLWALWADRKPGETPPPKAGLVSVKMSDKLPHAYYYASGYRPSGERAVRIDMLERLAGLIRTARNEAKTREGFETSSQMMSLVGCSGEEFEAILRSLGFRKHIVKRKIETPAPEAATADAEPIRATSPGAAAPGAATAEAATSQATAPDAIVNDAATLSSAPQSTEPASALTAPVEAPPESTPQTSHETIAAAAPAEPTPGAAAAAETKDGAIAAPEAAPAPSAPADKNAQEAPVVQVADAPKEIELSLWRPAPRKPAHAPKRDARSAGKPGERGKGKRAHDSKHDKSRGPRKQNAPRRHPPREKKADPNSPFAVLAGLKAELTNVKKDAKTSKAPETAE